MKTIVHKNESRGSADFGWLKSRHTFSFANYFHPERIHFGMLRVLNDDQVAPGAGFDPHPHRDMEIVSIPLAGALEHKDSMGTGSVIRPDEVQIMSAGTGIVHSEYNASNEEEVNFLQIWVLPKEAGIQPRYEQKKYDPADRKNRFVTVVSPEENSGGVWINQDATFSLGDFDAGSRVEYALKHPGHGAYVFVIHSNGAINIAGEDVGKRDAVGVYETERFTIEAQSAASLLVIEVPMN